MRNNVLLGLAEVDITPSFNVQTIGFNRKDDLSKGILHRLFAPNISIELEYFHFLREQVLFGVSKAVKNSAPIKAVWGMTEADIGVNRRDMHGVLDRRIGILKIVDADTEHLRLLILRVTAHANVLLRDNYLISSDFIGVTRAMLEEKYGCKVINTRRFWKCQTEI